MYTTIYAKVRINAGAHGKIMSNIGVKQGLPPYPTLFGMYSGVPIKMSFLKSQRENFQDCQL
jgi:hypothetical protein